MIWFLLAASTAFFESIKDALSKKSLQTSDEFVVAWALSFFTALFLLPLLFFLEVPVLGSQFGLALLVGATINTVSAILYIKAIKSSDLSITLPMIAFTPIFMIFTSPIIVGEWPSGFDCLGILFIVTGAYLLNLKEKSRGYLAPFKALMREKGPKLMLGVAFLWSISGNFDKVGVENSSPIFWAFSVFALISVLLLPVLLYKSRNPVQKIFKALPILGLMGFTYAIAVFCQMQALTLTLVVQVIAIKRTSVLMGVLWGKLFFNEKGLRERMSGSVTMILGVILMTLF